MKNSDYIDLCLKQHGNLYNYEKTVFTTLKNKVIIICKEHGEFTQRADGHLNGQKCPLCKNNGKKSTEQFILESKTKWGDQYDYSITEYINKNVKIKFICNNHGIIEQIPLDHIKRGCFLCNKKRENKYTIETFTKKANEIYNFKYDYSEVKFKSILDKVKIKCPEHGIFEVRVVRHLNENQKCPKCDKEKIVFIKKFELFFFKEFIDYIQTCEIDFKISNNKFAFNNFNLIIHDIEQVFDYEYEENTIYIYSYEWLNKKDIVKSRIMNLLGKNNKIGARLCKIRNLSQKEKTQFLKENHIQGNDHSKIFYGLIFNNKIVACMTFGESRFNKNYKWELIRYCSKLNMNVIGGASKLLNYFIKNYSGSIVSYADKRWSKGDLYKKLGFQFDGFTNPGYFYYKNNQLYNRIKFQKHKLTKMGNYDISLSETKIMQLNGYLKISDFGNSRWIYNIKYY